MCHQNLPWIAKIGKYEADNTPFDWFDSKCHGEDISNASIKEKMTDDTLIFMVNTAQAMKRPIDMLMFIGEYFKLHVDETERVIKENTDDKSSVQDAFFLTSGILNSLATAIKMYVDDAR